ncbi:MAG: PKD domain-containing protein [Candidatus Cloacimonetes bacterium]|nr:PKD domain-containing protein [Candidatus Cloacimonadota bacterium]
MKIKFRGVYKILLFMLFVGISTKLFPVTLNFTLKYQRKDTDMVCLDGCASELGGAAKHWHNSHSGAAQSGDHGEKYDTFACISMIATYYNSGTNLSQDRIAYYTQEEKAGAGDGEPEGDLGHNTALSYPNDITDALAWSLNVAVGDLSFSTSAPTFNMIKSFIDAGYPIMARKYDAGTGDSQMQLVYGYQEIVVTKFVYILDPIAGDLGMVEYNQWSGETQGVWICPASAAPRADEAGIWTDTDGDELVDFDEQVRFGTNINNVDSDGDGVNDLNDIREYVFNADDLYCKRTADYDNDSIRKEMDTDNDGDNFNDGQEDKNFNGKYEPALTETNNFDALSFPQFINADFTVDTTQGYSPLTVNFTDLSTQGTGVIDEWYWEFGDGNNSALQDPANEYLLPGIYTVSLTVTDDDDSTDTETKVDYITVYGNDPPAPPANVQINISGNDAIITWAEVDTTIYGDPINVNAYLVYYCGSPDSVYYFHGLTTDTIYTHNYVAQFSNNMFYLVTSYVGSLDLLQDVIAKHPYFKLGELDLLIEEKRLRINKSFRYLNKK